MTICPDCGSYVPPDWSHHCDTEHSRTWLTTDPTNYSTRPLAPSAHHPYNPASEEHAGVSPHRRQNSGAKTGT